MEGLTPDQLPKLAITLAALCGLLASVAWARVLRSIEAARQTSAPISLGRIDGASLLTSLALGLASVGWLWGRWIGAF